MSRFALGPVWLPIFALISFTAITWPVWQWLWYEWLSNQYYSHGLLILPLSVYLGVQRFRNDPGLVYQPGKGTLVGVLLLAAGLLLYLWFLQQSAYYLAAFAMIPMLAGTVWAVAGSEVVRRLIFPITYLMWMVPLPFLDRITLPLALFTGYCSGAIVQWLGLDVTIVGNSVTLPNADLVIGAQCSGVNSLITLLALLVLVAYVLEGKWSARLWLVLSAIPLAIAGNIVRVATLLFVARGWGAEIGFTFYHDYSGPIFFLCVLALIVPIKRWLGFAALRAEVI
ncbi:MAG: exosortase/archaeosortase family protein [Caldilinea sp.]|jgi:exosortase|nr:exosortase/archaeosortase family protein [Caldilinea sp.]